MKYLVYLQIDEHDSRYISGLKAMKNCMPEHIHNHCFQQDGTRHITICETFMDSIDELNNVSISQFKPFEVKVSGVMNWPSCVALAIGDSTEIRKISNNVNGIRKIAQRVPHISIYRKRNTKDTVIASFLDAKLSLIHI